jgi:hypothetical protein
MLTYRRSDILDVVGYSDAGFAGCSYYRRSTSGYTFIDGRRSCFVEKCQIDAYNFLNYGGRVYSLLPSYMSGYMVTKFYLRAGYNGYHCEATEDIL